MNEVASPRLFVAVLPDEAALQTLGALPRPVEPGVRWVPSANLHVTLRFLGPAPVDAVADALEAVSGVVTVARSGGPIGRLGRDALVVPVDGLDVLAGKVAGATAFVGRPAPGFSGHLTLARLKHRAGCSLTGRTVALSWPVKEFVLVASEVRPDGAVYTIARRYRLGGTRT